MNTQALCKALKKEGVTFNEFVVLDYLDREGDVLVGEIATPFGTSTAAATGRRDQMAKKNLIEEKKVLGDRRKVRIGASKEGAKAHKRILAEASQQ